MYQALYRKYRPKRFEDVVGQSHVTETLRRQVESGRLSHAYLFVGTRGTGKTTCAKILAKAANCLHPVNGDPCCECESCRGIENGSILDVVEMDAASNNGVDNIRDLRDEAIYSPANARKRVYIVDEVHMLSTPAFNALLKILEEPPEHLIFILATTELRKVPPTILSRCQRFSFRRISPDDTVKRLKSVSSQEGISLSDGAADMLARLADGSMRDALSLLDQCSGTGIVDEAQVMSSIGLAGSAQTEKILTSLINKDTSTALETLDELYFDGKDAAGVLGEVSQLVRDVLLRKVAPRSSSKLSSGVFTAPVIEKFSAVPTSWLMACLNELTESAQSMAISGDKRTTAELCLIKLCGVKAEIPAAPAVKDVPVEAVPPLKEKIPDTVPEKPKPEIPKPEIAKEPEKPTEDKAAPSPAVSPEPTESPEKETPAQGLDAWEAVCADAAASLDQFKASVLTDKANIGAVISGKTLEIRCKTDFIKTMISSLDVQNAIRDAAKRVMGDGVRIEITIGEVEKEFRQDKLDKLMKFGNVTMI